MIFFACGLVYQKAIFILFYIHSFYLTNEIIISLNMKTILFLFSLVCVLCCIQLFVTLWTVAHQAPLSLEFSWQKYWSVLPFPCPGDLPDTAIKPTSPESPTLAGRFFTTSPPVEALWFSLSAAAKPLQSCSTLCDPIDSSPSVSAVPGILQARVLEWVAISFSNAWKWKVKGKLLCHVRLLATPWTAVYQAPPSMGFSRQEYWSGVPLPSPLVFPLVPSKKGLIS